MYIYRVEHKTHKHGPYNPSEDQKDLNVYMVCMNVRDAHSNPAHPTMYIDTAAPRHDDNRCGCEDFESLVRWFDGLWEDMDAAGFIMTVYEINPALVYISKSNSGQVVYNVHNAICVDTLSITDVMALI